MKAEDVEVVRGSGNVFRDMGHADPDVEQLKAIFAAEIIKMLDRKLALQRLTSPVFATPTLAVSPLTAWFRSSTVSVPVSRFM
jgi:hypothetical protein